MSIKKLQALLLVGAFVMMSVAHVYAGWEVMDECTNSKGDKYKIKYNKNDDTWGVRENSNSWLIKDVSRAKAKSFYQSYCNK